MTAQLESDPTVQMTMPTDTASSEQWHSSLRDNLRFLKLWLRRPVSVGAVLPSGKSLALAMAEQIDPAVPGAVIELGGGTGSITAALLRHGVPREDLVVFERERALVNLLRLRFPGVRVIHGDARHMAGLIAQAGVGPVKAVVSGLPLLSLSVSDCHEIVTQAFATLRPDGVMVQFTYSPVSPVSRQLRRRLDIIGDRVAWVLDNVPPASIWTYGRQAA
jgi:phosphatidylethanolamine/phosphatidyl-N-methylethanolamine N-methyltransferase